MRLQHCIPQILTNFVQIRANLACADLYRFVQTCADLYRFVQICSDFYRFVKVRTDSFPDEEKLKILRQNQRLYFSEKTAHFSAILLKKNGQKPQPLRASTGYCGARP